MLFNNTFWSTLAMKKVLFLLVLCAAMSSCSDSFNKGNPLGGLTAHGRALEAVIPTDMSTWDKELAPHMKNLNDDERNKVARYLVRVKMGEVFGGEGIPLGLTVAQAIASQSEWDDLQTKKRAEEQALRQRLEEERARAVEEIDKAVTVTLLEKQEVPKDIHARRYLPLQVIRIGVENKSDKEIAGVAGEIKFINVFGEVVGSIVVRISEQVAPGKSITWTGSRDYNEFIDEHRAIWNLEEGKYTTRFEPAMVVFADGSKLGTVD